MSKMRLEQHEQGKNMLFSTLDAFRGVAEVLLLLVRQYIVSSIAQKRWNAHLPGVAKFAVAGLSRSEREAHPRRVDAIMLRLEEVCPPHVWTWMIPTEADCLLAWDKALAAVRLKDCLSDHPPPHVERPYQRADVGHVDATLYFRYCGGLATLAVLEALIDALQPYRCQTPSWGSLQERTSLRYSVEVCFLWARYACRNDSSHEEQRRWHTIRQQVKRMRGLIHQRHRL